MMIVNVYVCVCGYKCNEWLFYEKVVIILKWFVLIDII